MYVDLLELGIYRKIYDIVRELHEYCIAYNELEAELASSFLVAVG